MGLLGRIQQVAGNQVIYRLKPKEAQVVGQIIVVVEEAFSYIKYTSFLVKKDYICKNTDY